MDMDAGMAHGHGGRGGNGDPETHMWIAVLPLELEPKLHRCSAGWVHMEPLGLGAMEMLLIFETTSSVIAEVAPFLYLSRSYSGRPEIHSLAVILLYWQGQWEIKICCHFRQLSAPVWSGGIKEVGACSLLQHLCFSAPTYRNKSPVERMEWTWT